MMFRSVTYIFSALLLLSACKGGSSSSSAPADTNTATAQSTVDAATAGEVSGVVKFTGTKPKAQKIAMNADAYCKTTHSTDVYAEDVVVNSNNTLKWVYVYVKTGLGATKFPVPAQPAVFDQKGCTYQPHVAAVQAGQELLIRNSDGVLHNVNARPTKNPGFNFGQPIQGMETKKSFPNPEVMIPVKCDVHPWMHAWIGVQAHPYASVTTDDGSFSLKNLPPGEYEIEAWHEKYGTSVQKVTVGPKETKSIQFTFKG